MDSHRLDDFIEEDEADFYNMMDEAEEEEEKNEDEDKKTKKIDGTPKVPRAVTNPRPKLDADRLLDEQRGLPELLKMLSSFTFHPGREVEELRKMLNVYELWAHRLFPKFTFDDFLEKCEALGKKRAIKTHLRKVRSGQNV